MIFFLTSIPIFSKYFNIVQVLVLSLIGNAVKTGRARRCDLTLHSLFDKKKGTLLAFCTTVRHLTLYAMS